MENEHRVALIVAVAENRAIGKDNDLIWFLPRDLKFFKDTTQGHAVIMGRMNYLSIPEKYRPLPGRKNIVVTRNEEFQAPGCDVVTSIEAGIQLAVESGETTPFIIGGGQIYSYVLDHQLVDDLYITRVHASFDADIFFPDVAWDDWELSWEEHHDVDHRHPHAFTFRHFVRKAD